MARWRSAVLAAALLVPPAALSAQVCRGADTAPVLTGTIRDADHSIPLLGARVEVRWSGSPGDPRGVRSNADGRFRLCGLPAGASVTLTPRLGSRSGVERVVDLALDGGAGHDIDLSVPLSDPAAPSGLIGSVVARDGRAVVGADVQLEGHPVRRVTRADGTFVFDRVPAGSYVLRVEHLAYRAFVDTVHLAPGRPLEIQVPVATEPIPIEGIEITVRSTIWMRGRADLYERMERGTGHFITRAEIVDRGSPPVSSLLRSVPGVGIQFMRVAGREIFYPVVRGAGVPALYVDGARVSLDPGLGLGIDAFLSSDIDVIEIQHGPASIPIGMSGSCAACGVIHIWTRAP